MWRLASRAIGAAKSLHDYLMTCPPEGPVKLQGKIRKPKDGAAHTDAERQERGLESATDPSESANPTTREPEP